MNVRRDHRAGPNIEWPTSVSIQSFVKSGPPWPDFVHSQLCRALVAGDVFSPSDGMAQAVDPLSILQQSKALPWPNAAPACRRNPASRRAISRSPITTRLAPIASRCFALGVEMGPRHDRQLGIGFCGPAARSAPPRRPGGWRRTTASPPPSGLSPPAHRREPHCRGYVRSPGSPTTPSSTTSSGKPVLDAVGDPDGRPGQSPPARHDPSARWVRAPAAAPGRARDGC